MVLADDSLFLAGLLSMLRERPEIELIAVQDMDRDLDRRVREIAPHVVVVDRAALDRDGGDRLARVLRGRPRTTLVALRLDRPELEVFQASRVRRATWEEFVRIVSGSR